MYRKHNASTLWRAPVPAALVPTALACPAPVPPVPCARVAAVDVGGHKSVRLNAPTQPSIHNKRRPGLKRRINWGKQISNFGYMRGVTWSFDPLAVGARVRAWTTHVRESARPTVRARRVVTDGRMLLARALGRAAAGATGRRGGGGRASGAAAAAAMGSGGGGGGVVAVAAAGAGAGAGALARAATGAHVHACKHAETALYAHRARRSLPRPLSLTRPRRATQSPTRFCSNSICSTNAGLRAASDSRRVWRRDGGCIRCRRAGCRRCDLRRGARR